MPIMPSESAEQAAVLPAGGRCRGPAWTAVEALSQCADGAAIGCGLVDGGAGGTAGDAVDVVGDDFVSGDDLAVDGDEAGAG